MIDLVPPMTEKAQHYLRYLCVDIPNRCVGSEGIVLPPNSSERRLHRLDFAPRNRRLTAWTGERRALTFSFGDESFPVSVSPYSLGCDVQAQLVAVSTMQELEGVEAADKVLLLYGDLTKEQLMPKNFPFYNPDEHKAIVRLLETKNPAAIVAATSQNPELAGALYPFPLIEDGDFDIPSVYMRDDQGLRLLQKAGDTVSLTIRAQRTSAVGCNVIARKGDCTQSRVVIIAHIDAKAGTPGAIDNGTGVVILLLLAELLVDYRGDLGIEIVAVNGEDYYAASGEIQYVAMNQGKFDKIILAINQDGVGFHQGKTAYSLYNCPADITELIDSVFSAHPQFMVGEQWYQSDHSVFIMQGRPALALTSEYFDKLWMEIAHTPEDVPEIVDVAKVVDVAVALGDLLVLLNEHLTS